MKREIEELHNRRIALLESFEVIKQDSMNLNLTMEHIARMSEMVCDMVWLLDDIVDNVEKLNNEHND